MERLKNAPTVWHCAIHCKQRYRKFSSANADLAHFLGRFLPNGRVKRAKNATAADNETSFERFETPRARSFSLNRGPRKVYPDTDPWARSCLCCARPLASTSACELKATFFFSHCAVVRTAISSALVVRNSTVKPISCSLFKLIPFNIVNSFKNYSVLRSWIMHGTLYVCGANDTFMKWLSVVTLIIHTFAPKYSFFVTAI